MRVSDNIWLGDEASLINYGRVLSRIDSTPIDVLENLGKTRVFSGDDQAAREDLYGDSAYMVSQAGDIAVVNVSGSLTTSSDSYNRFLGLVGYDEIRAAVFAAAESGAKAIMLDMDTPGGEASGISELSDFLTEVDRDVMPVYTYTGTSMASGGYWLGSVGREIFASRLATVGSIGVVMVHQGLSRLYKDMGVDVKVLRIGEFKALGNPLEELSEKAEKVLLDQMQAFYDVFLGTVSENMKMSVATLKATAAEGRVFVGQQAVDVGLVNHLASYDSAIHAVSSRIRSTPRPNRQLNFNSAGESIMALKNRVLTDAGAAAIASGADPDAVMEDENLTSEKTDVPVTKTSSEETKAPDAPASDVTAAKDEPVKPGVILDHFERVIQLSSDLATVKAELAQALREKESLTANHKALVNITHDATNRMTVALGGAPIKFDDMDASIILAQYQRTLAQFNDRFKVGAQASTARNEDLNGSGDRPTPGVNTTHSGLTF